LVGSFRSVKLETLVRKLKEHNENIKAQLENLTKQLSNTQKAINELNDEFPQAISIDEKQEWIRSGPHYGGYTKELIEVRFEDGSYVTFEVLFSGEKRIFKVYDIEEEALTKQDKLNRLTQRIKI
jgi:guanylate kinase